MQIESCFGAVREFRRTGQVCACCLLVVLFVSISVAQTVEPLETIRVDSDLVDLKVSVLGLSPTAAATPLQQKDFVVLEDGLPQEITFFAASDAPFDLILLLDLSGLISDKI